jgi:hypothetical protein
VRGNEVQRILDEHPVAKDRDTYLRRDAVFAACADYDALFDAMVRRADDLSISCNDIDRDRRIGQWPRG